VWILSATRYKAFTGLSIRAEMVRGGTPLTMWKFSRNWPTPFKTPILDHSVVWYTRPCFSSQDCLLQVAMVVDRVLLLIFTTTTLGITAAILLHAPLSRDFLFGSDFTVDLAGRAAASDNQTSSNSSMWIREFLYTIRRSRCILLLRIGRATQRLLRECLSVRPSVRHTRPHSWVRQNGSRYQEYVSYHATERCV